MPMQPGWHRFVCPLCQSVYESPSKADRLPHCRFRGCAGRPERRTK